MAETETKEQKVTAGKKKYTPKTCEKCKRWQEVKQKMRIAEVLASAVDKFKVKLEAQDFKPTVAEYLKLVQMEQEYERDTEEIKEITVTWIEP